MDARLRWSLVGVAAGVAIACGPAPSTSPPPKPSAAASFERVWTTTGTRTTLPMGPDRQAMISHVEGSLLLTGAGRPHVGFNARAVVFGDTASGLVGRAVWTDERGDEAFSELRGEGTARSNRIVGT